MAYYGFKPAEQAIQIGDNTIVSADIADGSIVNADLNSSAAIALSKTQLVAGTGITLATNTLNVDAAQTQITSVGTIGTGVWQGTAVASAYLDADTAHLTTDQTLTGKKIFKHSTGLGIQRSSNAETSYINMEGEWYFNTATNYKMIFKTQGTTALTIGTDGNSIFTGPYLYLDAADNSNAKNLVFRSLNDTWLGQIEFHPSSTAQIVTRVGQPLALGANNIQILKLRHETNQWGAEITSQSPYGLHLHTTGTSSGHDALKISRHDNAIIFQVFADAATINKNALTVQGTAASTFAGNVKINTGTTSSDAFEVDASSLTSGRGMLMYSNSDRDTNAPLAYVFDNNGSNDGDSLHLRNDGGGDYLRCYNEGNVHAKIDINGEITSSGGIQTKGQNGNNPSGDWYDIHQKFFTYKHIVTSTHVNDGYFSVSHSINRGNVLGVVPNHYGYNASNVNNLGITSGFIERVIMYADSTLRVFIGNDVQANDRVYLTMIVEGNVG